MNLLYAPDPDWPETAENEIARLTSAISGLETVHHIGSTSVHGLPAKPIIDLLPVFATPEAQAAAQPAFEALGYEWLGAFGLPGRTYCRLIDPDTGTRRFHAHGYVSGDLGVRRHLAFRDALRDNAALRAAYASVKATCAALHPDGGEGYQDCKSGWIAKAEARAMEA